MVRLVFILLLLFGKVWAQTPLDNWLAQQDFSTDALQQIEMQWENIQNQGIAINFVQRQDLMDLGFLDVFQIHNLMQYREQSGFIYSPAELIFIKGFDRQLIELLRPYLDFRTHPSDFSFSPQLMKGLSYHLLSRFQFRSTNLDQQYLGDPLESRWRLRIKNRQGLSLGLNLQKDPGELWRGSLGFDHASFFLHYKGHSALRQVLIGDFQFNGALGLNLWSGLRFVQTSLDQAFQSSGKGLQAFAGNEEQQFFRGLALEYQWQRLNFQGFFSYRKLHARSEKQDGELRFRPVSGGYHRTKTERSRRRQLALTSLGFQSCYENSFLRAGILIHSHQLQRSVLRAESFKEQWSASQKSYLNSSWFLQAQFLGIHSSLELALDRQWDRALQLNWERKLGDRIQIGQRWHFFDPYYQSFWSTPQAAQGGKGERGMVQQIRIFWNYRLQTLVEYEHYSIPWPHGNWEGAFKTKRLTLLHRSSKRSQKWTLRAQWRQSSGLNRIEDHPELQAENSSELRMRALLHFYPHSKIGARTSIQAIVSPDSIQNWGLLIQQQLQVAGSKNRQLTLHYGICSIPQNLGALYEYESDLRLGFAIPAYRGTSIRAALIGRWTKEPFQIEMKLSHHENLDPEDSVYEIKIQCGLKL